MRKQVFGERESDHQEAIFHWTELNTHRMPELEFLYHTPNGGKRDARTAVALKRQGVKAGVPDLFLPVSRGGYHGLFIELKIGKGKTTEKQNEWINFLRNQEYCVKVCYGWREAVDLIETYLTDVKNLK